MFSKWRNKKPATTYDLNKIIDYIDAKTQMRVTGPGVRHKWGDSGRIISIDPTSIARAYGLKIAKVVTNATGGGYYNCYMQSFDATDWESNTSGLDDTPGRVRNLNEDGVAVDRTGGVTGLPCTAHGMEDGTSITIAGCTTAAYNGTHEVHADSTTDEIRITATYSAETFDGEETVSPDGDDVTVLNLAEIGVTDSHELSIDDIIICWKFTDDEGNSRWIGLAALAYTECT